MSAADRKWHKGPPPAVGWYPASTARIDRVFRFWNGRNWSVTANESYSALGVEYAASQPAIHGVQIYWRHQPRDWPANARTYERPGASAATGGTG